MPRGHVLLLKLNSVIVAIKSVLMQSRGEGVRNPVGQLMDSKALWIPLARSICMMNLVKVNAMITFAIYGDACPIGSVPKDVLSAQLDTATPQAPKNTKGPQ